MFLKKITVTNYQGFARDYLKKLIELMGAQFTPTLSGHNTVVIAAQYVHLSQIVVF
jgi:mediator of DNA damage checkpoint protein 1